ncbi:DNRLRE domain-containing protein [Paenibacillus tarimensis]
MKHLSLVLRKPAVLLAFILLFTNFFSITVTVQPKKAQAAVNFIHPGMLHTQSDLDRMKSKVALGETPWIEEWNRLKDNNLASSSYNPTFFEIVCRNDPGCGNTGNGALLDSSSAAYLNALAWFISGDSAHANKAIQILNGWSDTLTEIKGNDAILAASLYGYKLLNAAEIIRYTNAGWAQADIDKFTAMMTNIFYPITQGYGWIAGNGKWANGNWDSACIVFNMSYGVWINDEAAYDDAVNFYKTGLGNGSLEHYVQTDDGQLQESGRDQGHAQGGIGMLALAAEIGYNQASVVAGGGDMYSYPNNTYKLLRGIEYTAKYNLGYNVTWTTLPDVNGEVRYEHNPSKNNRGELRPQYEQVYHFYKHKIGLPDSDLQFTKKIVNAVKLEDFHYDSPSYGSLLNAQDQRTGPLVPKVALIARNLITKFISADNSGTSPLIANQDRFAADDSILAGPEEIFELEYLGNKTYTLKSAANGKYVTASGTNPLVANSDTAGTEQLFELNYQPNGLINIKSKANGKFVTLDSTTLNLTANATGITGDNGRFIVLHQQSGPADTTAPGAPANLTAAAASDSRINLSWTRSTDNDAVIGYKIYRNGTEVGTSYAIYDTTYSDTGLNLGTTYSYTVKAFDAAGNLSSVSNTASEATFSQPTEFVAADDAFVRSGAYANTNYGTDANLTVKASGGDFAREAYLKFDLSGYSGSVTAAKVRIYAKAVGANIGDTEASYVADDSWSEGSITWNTKPGSGTVLATWPKPAAGTYVEFDVTGQLNTELSNSGDQKLSIRIRNLTSGDAVEYSSGEDATGANRPVLIVTP